MKIIAGKSVLKNLGTQHVWVANKFDAKNTGNHESHNHIIVIAELSNNLPQEIKPLFDQLFEEIKHGDEEHQNWLKDKIDSFLLKQGLSL